MEKGIKNTTESGECNLSACNGLIFSTMAKDIKIQFGECKSEVPLFGAEGAFCFVNQNSVCPKISSKSNPGIYVSTEPCKEIDSGPRFIFLVGAIIASVFTVGLGSAVGVAYAIDPPDKK